jgi:SAM-dependent methyltransferase
MNSAAGVLPHTVRERALESGGTSNSAALYALTRDIVARSDRRGVVVDVGCGKGLLHRELAGLYSRYVGIDVVRHAGFPEGPDVQFIEASMDDDDRSLPAGIADIVCCLETIEHLENPRALARSLTRLAKPGGLVIVSTPNQLSLLSKLCLVVNDEFVHFRERPGLYPAHLSALLECDLRRIAAEAGWRNVEVAFTAEGRIPGTSRHWPRWLAARDGWRGRAFSDNIVLTGRTKSFQLPASSSRLHVTL